MAEKSISEKFDELIALQTTATLSIYVSLIRVNSILARNADKFDAATKDDLGDISAEIEVLSGALDKMIEMKIER